ncbi:hypothetical protein QYE76_001299 [Lolium multiflorum]|uniref:Uncharacterized protein n=1 Tax=Lolium multiflorum TaxID=4521 RepID=A0AAD8RKX8_LOLMU|nr:hypothetical protein QYE76_001299 [Lolium multiflorum]
MAKGSTVPPTMEPNMSRGDKDEDEYEEEDWVVSLRDKGESVFKVICKDKIASTHFFEILTTAIESQKLIWMHENTIDKKGALEREYANDVASLKNDLEEEQETIASLEEQLETLEVSQNEIVSKLTKERDHAKAQVKMLKKENPKVGVGHDKLVKDLDDLDKAHKVLESEHSILTKSHEQLQASYLKEHAMLPSLLDMSCDDACATNSTSCEASILKENVELRAQLELLTSNYGKLEENHGKLSSSHEDLLASHDRLKLAHEAIISKATPCCNKKNLMKDIKCQVCLEDEDEDEYFKYTGHVRAGMATMAQRLIDSWYGDMKKFHHHGHRLWGDFPLPNMNIEYAAIDAWVSYELYRKIVVDRVLLMVE